MWRIFGGFFVAVLAGCHAPSSQWFRPLPITGNAEALAGARAAPAVEARYGGVVHDVDVERRMERVGRRLALAVPELTETYRYCLLDSDEVNAVSLPGGYIYLTCGLKARLTSDDLMAAALAHEMAHLASKDHFKPRAHNPDRVLAKELSADRLAVAYLDAASLPPSAMIDLIRLVADAQPAGWSRIRADSLEAGLRNSR